MIAVPLGSAKFPERLVDRMGDAGPDRLYTIGDDSLLTHPFTAWFCSERVAPDLVLPALDLAIATRERGEAIASGFHSPVERECLELLLRGKQPVIACPAREIARLRLPRQWRDAVEAGRMLVVSAHGPRVRRLSTQSAEVRNRVIAALAERVFVVGASPGGRLHKLAREVTGAGQELACFDHPSNEDLLLLGAAAVPLTPPR